MDTSFELRKATSLDTPRMGSLPIKRLGVHVRQAVFFLETPTTRTPAMKRRLFLRTSLAAGTAAAATLTLGRAAAAVPVGSLGLHNPRWTPGTDGPLRLSSNENPLGPSEAARQAILDGMGEANRYTHGLAGELRARVAAHHGVDEASVVLGNGSTEVLRMAVQAMAGPGGWGLGPARLVVPDPTFEHVEQYAGPWGLELLKIPLRSDLAHDIPRMREAAHAAGSARRPVLVYICNPNNPTGTLTPCYEIEAWIREAEDVVFLVDEAYFEYVDHPSYWTALPLALQQPNVVVVRTFSKVYGLAGLRMGYGLAHPDAARRIRAFTGMSNLNAMGLLAATASLGDEAHVARSLRANAEARNVTYEALDELGLERFPSHANFVLHRIPGDQAAYIRRMREAGVWVGRQFPPFVSHNRLSFGSPEEMGRFAETLREFRRQGWV
jgi:histidinol-phosphate aminotransferase